MEEMGADDSVHGDVDDAVLREALIAGVCMGLPGVAVAIAADPEGPIIWEGSEGFADVQRKLPILPGERFCVVSDSRLLRWSVYSQRRMPPPPSPARPLARSPPPSSLHAPA